MKKRGFVLFLALLLIVSACSSKAGKNDLDDNQVIKDNDKEDVNEDVKEPEPDVINNIKILATGDIMYHNPQINHSRKLAGSEGYDFSEDFENIKEFMKDSDLTIGNFESTSTTERDYQGYPLFNTPPQVLDEVKEMGFDVLATCNNHTLDSNVKGIDSTIDEIHKRGIENIGTRKDDTSKELIKEFNGVNIGFLSYSYGFNGLEPYLKTEEDREKVNFLDPEQIENDIKEMRDKVDLIIVYPHWGVEYATNPTEEQIDLGRKMVEWGADLVIGNHPHLVEPCEYYTASDGRVGFIAYACGNFISNQRLETMDNIRTEQAVVFEIHVTENETKGEVKITDVIYHPLWVYGYMDDYGRKVQVHLAEEFMPGGSKSDKISSDLQQRAKKAYDMTNEILDKDI